MNPLKLIILRNQMYLMGEVTELDEEPSYLITNCYKITGETFEKYPLYSDQRDLFLTSDVILTIVDPSEDTIKNYKKAL
tara:strand:- start:1306 stop:1542 length:237 start_codon:yes stop_codon:yes gene_type:complete